MSKTHFDYIIIGNGLSGLQLALAMFDDSFFFGKTIALIDKSKKNSNDKTWSFWENSQGKWDAIVNKSWSTAKFYSEEKFIALQLKPYTYKSIKAIDFYNYALSKLDKNKAFTFIIDEVISVTEKNNVAVKRRNSIYTSNHVFDSRLPQDFFTQKKTHTLIHQHFKGWIIKTPSNTFDETSFTMMDYRMKYRNSTSFIYILPFSKTEALVEYTFFTPFLTDEKVYDEQISKYIKNILKVDELNIVETETGNIPMTDFPFQKYHTPNITKIGTAGGWVKGSTGYSFKITEKKVLKIIENLKNNQLPSKGLALPKFQFYDKIFLKVLNDYNYKGEWIFEQFYSKNSTATMFKFLDEETSFYEDLKIMKSLFSWQFIKAFFSILFRR